MSKLKTLIFIFFVIMASACRKQYNCVCNTTISYSNAAPDYYASNNKPMTEKMNTKQAKSVCEHEAANINQMYYNFQTNNGNVSNNGVDFSTECALK